ncbi:MAG: hypothetical protein M0D57_00665 [Sphingobacteriales bacterium JAD_PAG50586_3]|nr:MAG: hypothetical protein M0D57_00665 [Sphingobacteriales bacterium JAD_PAG50586_3]
MSLNIFQIWDSIGRKTPFAVRREDWGEVFYAIVEKIECEKMPYGKAYGISVAFGKYSNHFEYNKNWKKSKLIPNCGNYQWALVENVDLTIERK